MSMRRPLIAAALAVSAGVFASAAGAATVAMENFAYPAGDLHGRNGGTGWATAWDADAGTNESVQSTGLTYDVGGGLVGDDGSGALRLTGNTDEIAMRTIDAFNGDSLYVSFLFKLDGGAVDSADFLGLWFDNATGGTHNTNRPNIGVADDANNEFFARFHSTVSGQVFLRSGGRVNAGETFLVVGRIFKSNPGAANVYDRFSLWVNPGAWQSATPLVTAQGTSISSITHVGLRTANLDGGDALVVDELKLGATWNDVVPMAVPVPSAAFAGVALLGLIPGMKLARRMRRKS
jgi:hypothetical protein